MNKPMIKSLVLFLSILSLVAISFSFTVLFHEDGEDRVNYALVNHQQKPVTPKNFAGRYQLVFFGFTSCNAICPMQMDKLSKVMTRLEKNGYANQVIPLFISVDPERDTPQKVAKYLEFFHPEFVGLTGSRKALQSAADSFKTLLSEMPIKTEKDYQITHSSIVYLLDPFNRIIDYLPFSLTADEMALKVKRYL